MSAMSLIDDVARLGGKYLPQLIDSADDLAFKTALNTGRKLTRANRLAQVDAEKTFEVASNLKQFLKEGVVIDELPSDFIKQVTDSAIEQAKQYRANALSSGYDPTALKMGEAIGVLQNAAGRTGSVIGKVLNTPAAIPLFFLPDMYNLASAISYSQSRPASDVMQISPQQYY